MKSLVLLCALALVAAPVCAQPELPPSKAPRAKEAAPQIDPEAQKLVEAMVARYAALPTYSDVTRVEMQGGANLPAEFRAGYPIVARLSWNRPARLRFEGTLGGKAFLALSDETTIHVLKPGRPDVYVERLQHPPQIVTYPDGHTQKFPPDTNAVRLEAAVMESDANALGMAFMTDSQFWARTLEDVKVVALETDAETDGEACRVVNVQAESAPGSVTLMRLWIAESDGLLRRVELSDAGMGANSKIIETHSRVTLSPTLPDSTWEFVAPAGAKAVDYFPDLDPHKYDPTIKVGDSLPAFSGDALDGKPIELNAKSGKVTVLCFFTLGMGPYDARGLQGLQNKLGADKMEIVGVVGDGRRAKVEKLVADNHLTIPIFFDEAGMNNRLAGVFGVQQYTTTLVFGADGKLAASLGTTRGIDFMNAIQKLFPGETGDSILKAMDAETPAGEMRPFLRAP